MNAALFSSSSTEWATPPELFDALHAEFRFTIDVCASAENARIPYFNAAVDGLAQNWKGHRCYMNPPYGRKSTGLWVAKAATCGALVVALLPARTDTVWWHAFVWDAEKHQPRPGVSVRFLRGRLKFGGAEHGAPFPSVVVVFHPRA